MKISASICVTSWCAFVLSSFLITQDVIGATHVDWAKCIGGDGGQGGQAIAIGSDGCIHVAGITVSTNYPVKNAFQARLADNGVYGRNDLFVCKTTPDGSNVIYSTYLGGCSEETLGNVKLDSSNNLYIIGYTSSSNFPAVNGFRASLENVARNAFLVKVNPTGGVVFATCFGTNVTTIATAVDVDAGGNIYIGGCSGLPSFPGSSVLTQTNNTGFGGFIAKFGPNGTNRIFSCFIGGVINGIAVDNNGRVSFAGTAGPGNDERVNASTNAFQRQCSGRSDLFAGRLSSNGDTLDYLTYLGGTGKEECDSMGIDSNGNTVLVGSTTSTNFPVTTNAIQKIQGDECDGFISVLSNDGHRLIYSTYLGGDNLDVCKSVSCIGGVAYVAGTTSSTNFPTVVPVQASRTGETEDGFVAMLNIGTGTFSFSSYFGGPEYVDLRGIATGTNGVISVTGSAGNGFYPLIPFSGNTGGRANCLIMKISQ